MSLQFTAFVLSSSKKRCSFEYLITFYTWKIVSTRTECTFFVHCCSNYHLSFFPLLCCPNYFVISVTLLLFFCSVFFFSIWPVLSSSSYYYIIKGKPLAIDKNLYIYQSAMRKWVCFSVVQRQQSILYLNLIQVYFHSLLSHNGSTKPYQQRLLTQPKLFFSRKKSPRSRLEG